MRNPGELLRQLAGGDRRSIGKANRVVQQVLADPGGLEAIVDGLFAGDAVVRMRCADVAEKVSALHPEWLQPYKKKLLGLATRTGQPELRWHLAQMLPRLKLAPVERSRAVQILFGWLDDESSIVRTFAMEGLACLGSDDPRLRARLTRLFEDVLEIGTPAMRARARKLLVCLGRTQPLSGGKPSRRSASAKSGRVVRPARSSS